MSEEIAEKPTDSPREKFLELNYAQMAADQRKVVEALEAKLGEAPSEALQGEFDRQLDKLRFFENAYQWDPRDRAKKAALSAKESVLRRAMV